MKQKPLNIAIMSALGVTLMSSADIVSAEVINYSWQGYQTVLAPDGEALADTSITTKGANQYQTPISGTLAFDYSTGSGIATIEPFYFFNSSTPGEYSSIDLQSIGDGMGGPGTLLLGNMLWHWKGNYGIPVSIVMDAAGFFGATSAMFGDGVLDQTDVAGFGAAPAADGTYTGAMFGYLGTGPVPIATTEWNLTRANACGVGAGNCMGVNPSGFLPLIVDTAVNGAEYAQGDGAGIGGVPMWDGPFVGYNINFDITEMTTTVVPVPAAVWLFGSGLLGLIGVAKRKKPEI